MRRVDVAGVFGLFGLIGVFAPCAVVAEGEFDEALTRAEARVEKSLAEFNEIETRVRAEKVPLLENIGNLEDENIDLREKRDQLRLDSEDRKEQLEEKRKELEKLQAQADYIHGVFNESLVNFESRLHVAEDQKFKPELTRIRTTLEKSGIKLKEKNALFLEVANMNIDRQRNLLGGYVYDGRVINPDGQLLEGMLAVLGPTAYFTESSGGESGLVVFNAGTLEPALIDLDQPHSGHISAMIGGAESPLPFDASLGNAIALRAVKMNMREHISQGGPVGYSILVLGSFALLSCLVIVKDLHRHGGVRSDDVHALAVSARDGEIDSALSDAGKLSGSFAEMLKVGIENVGSDTVFLEEVMLSVVARTRALLERFLPFLAITVVAAPLLGLLGTVVGMIKTFALITVFGSGDPKSLSSGISEALVTTEIGLVVAIIILLLHALFARMIRTRLRVMEQMAFDFVRYAAHKEAD